MNRLTANRLSLGLALLAILLLAAILRFYRLDSLPPGLWFDEAWSAVAARDSAAQGIYPPYYAASFGGMHPAIVYLARLAQAFSGSPLALRYAVAIVSTLTVAVAFFAYRAIWAVDSGDGRGTRPSPQTLALLAALILAITYPFLHFSRLAFESSLPTLAGLLVFGCLAWALQRERPWLFALTGGVLGLSLYSFDTARLFPFALSLAFWGVVVLHRRPFWRQYLGWFVLLAGTAVVVFLPLGYFALTHWDAFAGRGGITTYNTLGPGAASVPLAVLRNVWRTMGGLVLPGFGDVIARHNLPGRPVFDPFLGILFVLGAARLARWWRRPSSIILAAWAGVMLLPVILTDGAPTYTRIFGALPALAAIAALSWAWSPPLDRRRPYAAFVSFLLLLSLATTARDYFGQWANLPQLFDDFNVADWRAGNLALARLADGPVYLVPNQVDEAHPTLDLLLRGTAVRGFPSGCLVWDGSGERPSTYIIHMPSAPDTLAALQALYPTGQPADAIISPLTGQTVFQAYTASNPHFLIPGAPVAQFGAAIELVGSPVVSVGETAVTIPILWQAAARPAADHTLFIHLYRAGEEASPPLAQLDVQPCLPTGQWQPGERIQDRYTLALPPDLPPGDYSLALGWYTWPTFTRLPLAAGDAALSDDRLLLGQFTIGG